MHLHHLGNQTLDDHQLLDLRTKLREDPNLWRERGNLAASTRMKVLAYIPERTVQHECVKSGIQHMRNSFLKDGATEQERIAVEQILTCWLQSEITAHK